MAQTRHAVRKAAVAWGGSWSLPRKGKARHQPKPSWQSWLHTEAKRAARSSGLYLFNVCSTHVQRGSLSYDEFSLLRFSITQSWSVYCFLSKQCSFRAPFGTQGCAHLDGVMSLLFFFSSLTQPVRTHHLPSFLLMKTHGQFTIRFLPLQYSDPNSIYSGTGKILTAWT